MHYVHANYFNVHYVNGMSTYFIVIVGTLQAFGKLFNTTALGLFILRKW